MQLCIFSCSEKEKSDNAVLQCRLPVVLIELVFFLYKTGESMLDATIRPYILHMVCHQQFPANVSVCGNLDVFPVLEEKVQSDAGTILIYYRLLLNVPALFLGLFCGAWSDQHGRKIPMMLPSIGSALSVIFYLASVYSTSTSAIVFILVGAFVQGSFGKSSMITMAVNSYCSDVTDKADRTRHLGTLLAMNFFGLSAGALLAGIIEDLCNVQSNLFVNVVLHAIVVFIVSVYVKEADALKNKHDNVDAGRLEVSTIEECASTEKSCDSIITSLEKTSCSSGSCAVYHKIIDTLKVLKIHRDHNSRFIVLALMFVMLINQTCKVGEIDITLLFVSRSPLNWSSSSYAYLLSTETSAIGLCLLIVLPFFSNTVHLSDAAIVMIGLTSKIVRLLWMSFADESWMVYVSVVIGSLTGLIMSSVRSLLSKTVNEDELGKVFSLLASAETLAKFLGTAVFVHLYKGTVNITPGFTFLIESVLYGILIIVVLLMFKDLKQRVVRESQLIFVEGTIDDNKNNRVNVGFADDSINETSGYIIGDIATGSASTLAIAVTNSSKSAFSNITDPTYETDL